MADIKTHLNNIKGALYGKDVRGSIHDGIDAINKEVENTTGRQVDLENTFDQLVINAGNSNAEIVDARVKNDGTSYSKLGDRLNEVDSQLAHIAINVKDFGAVGDGVIDDTEAFKKALSTIKSDTYSKGGHKLLIPVPDKYYKITDTIDLTEIWNLTIEGVSRYSWQRQGGNPTIENEYCLLHWYGSSDKPMFLFDYTFSTVFKNVSINGMNICDVGIQVAPLTEKASVNRNIVFYDCDVKYCNKGVVVGEVKSATDSAPVSFYNCCFMKNIQTGIQVSSGNSPVLLEGCTIFQNGENVSSNGCNIHLVAGELTITGCVTDGKPQDSDIIQNGGGLKINGIWSDITYGMFLRSTRCDLPSYLNGVRHYDSAMTEENTPISINWQGPQPLVLEGCYLTGDVVLNSGNMGHLIDIGTRFSFDTNTFRGNQIENQYGYIGIGGYRENNADLSIGKPINKKIKSPMQIHSKSNRHNLTRQGGNLIVTDLLNDGDNGYSILINCYYDETVDKYKSIKAGMCTNKRINNSGEETRTYNATRSDEVITFSNMFKVNYTTTGSNNGAKSIELGGNKIMFDSNIPSGGTWNVGDVIFNRNYNGTNNYMWVYSSTGWVPKS